MVLLHPMGKSFVVRLLLFILIGWEVATVAKLPHTNVLVCNTEGVHSKLVIIVSFTNT